MPKQHAPKEELKSGAGLWLFIGILYRGIAGVQRLIGKGGNGVILRFGKVAAGGISSAAMSGLERKADGLLLRDRPR